MFTKRADNFVSVDYLELEKKVEDESKLLSEENYHLKLNKLPRKPNDVFVKNHIHFEKERPCIIARITVPIAHCKPEV